VISVSNPRRLFLALVTVLALAVAVLALPSSGSSEAVAQSAPGSGRPVPHFEVDPFWPKPLPEDWVLGQVAGIDVDQHDRIWIVQRPGSLVEGELFNASPAPPVMAFDPEGNLLKAWGGPGEGFEWPQNEHGIWVDHNDNVWIAGNGDNDHQVLKFTADGDFLLQIGRAGMTGGSNDTELLGQPADGSVDPDANEVYIADGYLNKRVIVFDADTGEYKRHWGAFGAVPDDDPDAPDQFGNPVHCAVLADDGLVYVCDRANNRVHVFQKDGTFVREFFVAPETMFLGTTWDLDFSADKRQTFLYLADGTNQRIWILDRASEEALTHFGREGRYAGQFHWVHNAATDSKGNLYTAEVDTGKRAQKFVFRGRRPVR
jgi:DNA-binding beta-propeller fold protein YncE